jgi:hypothetical protein
MGDKTAKIEALGKNQIVITFPEGTRAAIRTKVDLDKLLETIGGPEPDVEAQGENPVRSIIEPEPWPKRS